MNRYILRPIHEKKDDLIWGSIKNYDRTDKVVEADNEDDARRKISNDYPTYGSKIWGLDYIESYNQPQSPFLDPQYVECILIK